MGRSDSLDSVPHFHGSNSPDSMTRSLEDRLNEVRGRGLPAGPGDADHFHPVRGVAEKIGRQPGQHQARVADLKVRSEKITRLPGLPNEEDRTCLLCLREEQVPILLTTPNRNENEAGLNLSRIRRNSAHGKREFGLA
jgi:hypothetical protein